MKKRRRKSDVKFKIIGKVLAGVRCLVTCTYALVLISVLRTFFWLSRQHSNYLGDADMNAGQRTARRLAAKNGLSSIAMALELALTESRRFGMPLL